MRSYMNQAFSYVCSVTLKNVWPLHAKLKIIMDHLNISPGRFILMLTLLFFFSYLYYYYSFVFSSAVILFLLLWVIVSSGGSDGSVLVLFGDCGLFNGFRYRDRNCVTQYEQHCAMNIQAFYLYASHEMCCWGLNFHCRNQVVQQHDFNNNNKLYSTLYKYNLFTKIHLFLRPFCSFYVAHCLILFIN